MLSNAYFLAKFRFDTAENEPAKICKILLIFPILLTLTPNPYICVSPADRKAFRPSTPSARSARSRSRGLGTFDAEALRPALADGPPRSSPAARCDPPMFAKFWRARSQRYRSRFLRVNISVALNLQVFQISRLFDSDLKQMKCASS